MVLGRSAVEKLDALLRDGQARLPIKARAALDWQPVRHAPRPLETLGNLADLRAYQSRVHVAPAGGNGHGFGFSVGVNSGLIDQVHATEIGGTVIHDQQLAVVAAI